MSDFLLKKMMFSKHTDKIQRTKSNKKCINKEKIALFSENMQEN